MATSCPDIGLKSLNQTTATKLMLVLFICAVFFQQKIAIAQQSLSTQQQHSSSLYSDAEKARRDAALKTFLKLIGASKSEAEGQLLTGQIWQFWLIGPDEMATKLLADGMRERDSYNYEKALSIFQELVEKYPHFTEARNQRAFLYFLTEKYDASLQDLDSVIAEMPDHFAAHAGRGLVLLRQGRTDLAQSALKRARAINPWINERHLIVD